MTTDQRLERIEELRQKADEGRARIAERQAARENDPAKMQDYLFAAVDEPIGSPPMPSAPWPYQPEPAPEPVPAASDDDLDDYTKGLVKFTVQYVAERDKRINTLEREIVELKRSLRTHRREVEADRKEGIQVFCTGIERRFAALEAENVELKGMLGDALRLGKKR